VLLLSLLYRCWAQQPEDRPSAAEINALASLEEFPKLADTVGNKYIKYSKYDGKTVQRNYL